MRLLLWGINHRTAPLALRERMALSGDALMQFEEQLHQLAPEAECVVVSTCNRTEVWLARPAHAAPDFAQLTQMVAKVTSVEVSELLAVTIQRENQEAITHLFRVACGLDSMVLGEPQILGQVKRAYAEASQRGRVGPMLHRVFQQAIAGAKQVRTQTGIDQGRRSIGSVAVDFARQVFETFNDKTIVGIGAGEMAKLTLHHLRDLHPKRLWITNRTRERAMELAEQLGLQSPHGVRSFEDLDSLLVEADIVLTATSAPQPILTMSRFSGIVRRRRGRPMFILDIALPRDVEAQVGSLSNVYLYNLDDLQQVIGGHDAQRSTLAEQAEKLVLKAAHECLTELQNRDVGRLIRALRQRLHDFGEHEQQRTLAKLQAMDEGELRAMLPELLSEHTTRVINKVLHLPLSQLDRRQPGSTLAFHAAALRRLFDLHDETQPMPHENAGEASAADATSAQARTAAADDMKANDVAGDVTMKVGSAPDATTATRK